MSTSTTADVPDAYYDPIELCEPEGEQGVPSDVADERPHHTASRNSWRLGSIFRPAGESVMSVKPKRIK